MIKSILTNGIRETSLDNSEYCLVTRYAHRMLDQCDSVDENAYQEMHHLTHALVVWAPADRLCDCWQFVLVSQENMGMFFEKGLLH